MAKIPKKVTEGFRCKCGKYFKYPPYVYAHWDIGLIFTCPGCAQQHYILAGKAKRIPK
jgi:hypothetical protein